MGNSWLRSHSDGNVSVSGCGEPIPPSTSLRGRSSAEQSAGLSDRRLPVRVRSSPLMVVVV